MDFLVFLVHRIVLSTQGNQVQTPDQKLGSHNVFRGQKSKWQNIVINSQRF